VVAPNLRHLYPDLNDSDFQSSIALFHQRYSTNTFPMWYTAQPFRMLAHNGEINTLQGNVNWMRMRCVDCCSGGGRARRVSALRRAPSAQISCDRCAHLSASSRIRPAPPSARSEETLHSPLFGSHFKDLLPVIQTGGSDSAMLDNVLELLVQCGRSPLQAMSLLVPEAYENNKIMDSKLRAFYDYNRTLQEPWDGPAALCFTDGRTVAATLDRNGLRPLRYWLTSGGKLIAGSEVGIVDVAVERVVERGRLGPGDMLAVDTERGLVLRNEDIKEELSSRRPYQAWIERSINNIGAAGAGAGSTRMPLSQVMSYQVRTQQR
jgi:glutamate synthase (ferredoxin)